MKKIVIIGSPGAGKSTFARALGDILQIEIFHLDRYFWQPGWKEYSRATRIEKEKSLVEGRDTWIIEGTYLGSSDFRLQIADTIIFIDTPVWLCFYRLIERYIKWHGRSRYDIPEGCTDRLDIKCLLKALTFPLRGRRMLHKKLKHSSERVIRLHSSEDIQSFLAQLVRPGERGCASASVLSKQEMYSLVTA